MGIDELVATQPQWRDIIGTIEETGEAVVLNDQMSKWLNQLMIYLKDLDERVTALENP